MQVANCYDSRVLTVDKGVSQADLDVAWSEGCSAWPGLDVSRKAFDELFLEKRALSTDVEAKEVYVAAGCGEGDTAAIRAFEETYFPHLHGRLQQMRLSSRQREEVVQELREKLFVGKPGQRARICDYAGDGKLPGLIKVTAYRCAIDVMREASHFVPMSQEAFELPTISDDAELLSIRAEFQTHFKKAFASAVEKLSSKERNILRMRFMQKLSIDQIAKLYGTHRATIFRWLASAREAVLLETRSQLAAELALDRDRLDSLFGLMDSKFEASIEALLETRNPETNS